MSYTAQSALSADATFRGRISMAVALAAIAVQSEDPAALAVPKGYNFGIGNLHALRSALATRILADNATWTALFAIAVAADPNSAGLSANSSDSDLLFTVNSVYNAFAVNH